METRRVRDLGDVDRIRAEIYHMDTQNLAETVVQVVCLDKAESKEIIARLTPEECIRVRFTCLR